MVIKNVCWSKEFKTVNWLYSYSYISIWEFAIINEQKSLQLDSTILSHKSLILKHTHTHFDYSCIW